MSVAVWLVLPAGVSLLAAFFRRDRSGVRRRVVGVLGVVLLIASGAAAWWFFDRPPRALPEDPTARRTGAAPPATSADCARCHPRHYQSWYRTYHRTMTREATPENVKGDFADAVYHYQDLPTRLTRRGDEFFMDTVDPNWALLRARAGGKFDTLPPPRFREFRVDRLVGSHWIQECLHRLPGGRYIRLPVLYHIGERRWLQANGAFLAPDMDDFWALSRGSTWNDTCLYCHNTGPSKNPVRGSNRQVVGFNSEVLELGIACAACHGQGAEHVRFHDRAANEGLTNSREDIVQPAHLPVARRDDICGRCHGAIVPKQGMWDPHTYRDPFVPGEKLTRYNSFFWSEAEQAILAGHRPWGDRPARPEPTDGRFWGDGTPLTTALEYNGMALSACYRQGHGKLSCLSCHTMHGSDPNFLLKPGMATNQACYGCHGEFRNKLAEHTLHRADSPGSLCYNCHMPHQVYSLMTAHRSHRIQTPDLESSVGTGKPHACNLCHLDKSLGWTRTQLARWPGQKRKPTVPLSADEERVSALLLTLARGDARSRVVVAGALSNPAALKASGGDWIGSQLTRLLDHERYPAVRYLAHRGLQAIDSRSASQFDSLATPFRRREQLRSLRARFDAAPVRRPLPGVPLTPKGLPDEATLDRLRANRNDPNLTINE